MTIRQGQLYQHVQNKVNNHKSKLSILRNLSIEDRSKEDLIYRHFFLHEHEGLNDVQVVIIDQAPTEFILREREAQQAYRRKTLTSILWVLNVDDCFDELCGVRESLAHTFICSACAKSLVHIVQGTIFIDTTATTSTCKNTTATTTTNTTATTDGCYG